jgi:hypothetical protein
MNLIYFRYKEDSAITASMYDKLSQVISSGLLINAT